MAPVAFDWSWMVGSGSLYSTPRDLLRWTRAVLRDGFVDRRQHPFPYGWALRERHQQRVIEQSGRIPAGYSARISYLPQADLAVIVLANLQTEATNRLAEDLESLALGDSVPPVRATPGISLSAAQGDSLAGRYEMFPGFVLSVRAQKGGVWLAGPDGDFMPLDAVSSHRFFFRLMDVPVDFPRDSLTGAPTLLWNGQFTARRLP
jgi:CubicO group peptidase (beta-lactamase class C family)